MQQRGVQIESWGPLAEGKNDIHINPTLVAIADAHGRSVAQVVLRSACSTCACAAARPFPRQQRGRHLILDPLILSVALHQQGQPRGPRPRPRLLRPARRPSHPEPLPTMLGGGRRRYPGKRAPPTGGQTGRRGDRGRYPLTASSRSPFDVQT